MVGYFWQQPRESERRVWPSLEFSVPDQTVASFYPIINTVFLLRIFFICWTQTFSTECLSGPLPLASSDDDPPK